MPKKPKTPKNDPIVAIKRIARAMKTKVSFGSQTTSPDNHWCQIESIFEPSRALAIGWGSSDQEAAGSCLRNIAGRLFVKFLEKGRRYYMVVPTQNGYYVMSSDDDISATFIKA